MPTLNLINIPTRFIGCFFILMSLLFSTSSCRYRLQGSTSVLPSDVKTISIKNADNGTTISGLGPRFTEKLRGRFERYGVVKIVDAGESADAELVSRIRSVDTRNRDVQGRSNIQVEQDLILLVSAELRKKNGQILYRNPEIRVEESFGTVSSNVVTSSSSFATGNLGAGSLKTLTDREVARGQAAELMEEMMDEAARKIYIESVASDF